MNPIETERLVLRDFREEDASSLLEYLHKPTASCFFDMALANMEAATAEVNRRSASGEYIAVCLKDSGRLIGDLFAMSEDADTFSIGWNLNLRFSDQGYAFEAAHGLVHHLFTEKAARRLYAYVETTNVASEKLCVKLGMRREGVFKEFISFQNDSDGKPVYVDTMQYAILRKEWTHPID